MVADQRDIHGELPVASNELARAIERIDEPERAPVAPDAQVVGRLGLLRQHGDRRRQQREPRREDVVCRAVRVQAGAGTEPIHVRPAATPLVVVGSRSHRGDSLDGLLARIGPHELRPMGSALKFCLVAEGSADFYPRLGPTSEWDTAAAQAVLEVAGGAVTTLDGTPLRYNQRETLLNPHFIAYGDRTRNWAGHF